MQVTQGVGHAFHALVQMALAPPGRFITIDELARSLAASPSYMSKLFQRLSRAGLVASHRGRDGGYSLMRPANDITLWEVVAALQDNGRLDVPLFPSCLSCPLVSACPLVGALQAAREKSKEVLRRVNVGEMAQLLKGGSGSMDVGELASKLGGELLGRHIDDAALSQ